MIYLFTALYCEAHGLIRKFGLARNPKNTWLQEFYNQEAGIRLTITGVGRLPQRLQWAVCAGHAGPPGRTYFSMWAFVPGGKEGKAFFSAIRLRNRRQGGLFIRICCIATIFTKRP